MNESTPKHIYVVDVLKNVPEYKTKFALLEAYITDEIKKKNKTTYDNTFAAIESFSTKIIAKMHDLKQISSPHIELKPDDFPIDPSYQPTSLDKDYLIEQLYSYLHWISCHDTITDKEEGLFSSVLDRALELIDPDKYPCQQGDDSAKEVHIPVDQICEAMSCAGSPERMMKCIFMYVTAMAHTYHTPKLSLDFGCDTPTIIPILFTFIPKDIRELTIKCSITNTERLSHFVVSLREYLSRNYPLTALEMNAGKPFSIHGDAPLFTRGEEDNLYLDYLAQGLKNNDQLITMTGNLLDNMQARIITALKSENAKLKTRNAELKSEYANLAAVNADLKSEHAKLKAEKTELQYVNARQKAQLAEQPQPELALPQTTEIQLPRPT